GRRGRCRGACGRPGKSRGPEDRATAGGRRPGARGRACTDGCGSGRVGAVRVESGEGGAVRQRQWLEPQARGVSCAPGSLEDSEEHFNQSVLPESAGAVKGSNRRPSLQRPPVGSAASATPTGQIGRAHV